MVLESAIGWFEHSRRLRRPWLWSLKKLIGAALVCRLVPAERRRLFASVHSQLAAALAPGDQPAPSQELVIELSSICNAKCSFCTYPSLQFPKKLMPEQLFFQAVELGVSLGIKSFNFTPCLWPSQLPVFPCCADCRGISARGFGRAARRL